MTKIKLTDNLSLSQIIRGFWRLDTWELSTDELIDNMKSSIDLGVTSFDTAEIYADTLCESQIGEAFAKDPAYDLICYLDALYAGNKRISGPTDKVLGHHGAGIFWNIEDWTISE